MESTFDFNAMMQKHNEYKTRAEKRKIDFFLQEISQEGRKYLKEKLTRNDPDLEYLGMNKAYKKLNLSYEDVRLMETGKYKLELKKI